MKVREISIVLFIISSIINILAWLTPFIILRLVMTIIVVSLVLVFFLLSHLFWKCPYCKEHLPIRIDFDNDLNNVYQCPYCGKKFE